MKDIDVRKSRKEAESIGRSVQWDEEVGKKAVLGIRRSEIACMIVDF